MCHRPFFGITGLNSHKKKFCNFKNGLNQEKMTVAGADKQELKQTMNERLQTGENRPRRYLNKTDSQNDSQGKDISDTCKTQNTTQTSPEQYVHRTAIAQLSLNDNCGKDTDSKESSNENDNIVTGSVSRPAEDQPKSYKCERCSRKFKNSSSLKHHIQLAINVNSVQECAECNMKFCLPKELSNHKMRHVMESKDGNFMCKRCGKKLASHRMLLAHCQRAAMQSSVFECEVCSKQFCLPKDLSLHRLIHKSSFACDICNKELKTGKGLREHMKTHSEATHRCEICDKLFTVKKNLTRHLETHAVERKHKCHLCDKAFRTKVVLRGHFKSHGIKVVPYECELCGKVFGTKFRLKSHKIFVHKQAGKYPCAVCGKNLPTEKHLQRHLRTHTGEKTLKCDICEKLFKEKSQLSEHQRGVHGIDVRHRCTHCGKGFYSKSRFDSHMRCHLGIRPYPCGICNKAFGSKSGLDCHTRVHTGYCPYECQICKKKFKERTTYKLHLRIHSGEKPHECDICKKRFTNPSNYKKHLKVHRKEMEE